MPGRLVDLPNYAAFIPNLLEQRFLGFEFSRLDSAGFQSGAGVANR